MALLSETLETELSLLCCHSKDMTLLSQTV